MSHPIQILPSLLSCDFSRMGEDIAMLESAGTHMLHFDVMDGRFVPNISMGLPILEAVRKATSCHIDAHLMIVEPERYVEAFRDAGADSISIHQEASPHLHRTLSLIKSTGAQAGVVLNPGTPVSTLEDVLDLADFVLVMSVNPGFGGQKFIPGALHKVRQLDQLRSQRNLTYAIEIDGGVDHTNIADIATAGCDWFVAGSSVFRSESPATAVRGLHARACSGRQILA
ncbi:ribulose-phosphate 3-epimerase [Bryobacter aggregatus]|uniref:ribulose-phosphate 3-epimerase n=1 Tax=Bryobacter aggregatus TaxID=360054 RepID=UPI0004E182C8|nr:ribulose-phosphate 3-epimerase [Bryobacter aggregatus]